MKKLLIIALVGLSNISSQCMNISRRINHKTFSHNKSVTATNGKVQNRNFSFFSVIFGSTMIQDSGITETKEVPIEGIKDISAYGPGNLFIKQCEDQKNCIEKLLITADSNILPHLTGDVYGNKLTLGLKNNVCFHTNKQINYHATVRNINRISNAGSMDVESPSISTNNLALESSGSGDFTIKNIVAQQLAIQQSGSADIRAHIKTNTLSVNQTGNGDIILSGNTNEQKISAVGSGDYKAKNLNSKFASFEQCGSGDIYLNVIEEIKGSSVGSGDVLYNGIYNPKINVAKVGSGKVKKSSW